MHKVKLSIFTVFMLFISSSMASIGKSNKELVLYVMPVKTKGFINLAPSAMDQFSDFLDDYFNHNIWEFTEVSHSIVKKRKKIIFKIKTPDFGQTIHAYTLEVRPKCKRLRMKLIATSEYIKILRERGLADGSYINLKKLRKQVEQIAIEHIEDIKGYW